jgi:hypothetical protein
MGGEQPLPIGLTKTDHGIEVLILLLTGSCVSLVVSITCAWVVFVKRIGFKLDDWFLIFALVS